jgi:hypothetical protein
MNMHEDMRTLLNAYLDGELHDTRLLEIQRHLSSCESCRNELIELRLVSDLLRADPPPEFMPAERFVSNLTLSLPRRNLQDLPQKSGSLAWWLVPAGLLGVWFFVQTVFALTDVVTAVGLTGMPGHIVNWLGGGHQMVWFVAVASLFGGQSGGVQSTLSLLNGVNVLGANLLKGFLWQALIVMLYWGWLFAWWLLRRSQPMQMENAS